MYVPDNYDAYKQHEAERESWLSKRPICECCGEPIQDDYLYEINGDILCEECMKGEYRKWTENYEKEN